VTHIIQEVGTGQYLKSAVNDKYTWGGEKEAKVFYFWADADDAAVALQKTGVKGQVFRILPVEPKLVRAVRVF
jgi:hypothetical protein